MRIITCAYLTNHLFNSIHRWKRTIDPTDNYGLHQKFRLMNKGKGHVARQLLRENFTNRRCARVPISSCQKVFNILPGLRGGRSTGKSRTGRSITRLWRPVDFRLRTNVGRRPQPPNAPRKHISRTYIHTYTYIFFFRIARFDSRCIGMQFYFTR